MALEDIVNVQITAATTTPTRPGFGTALFACSDLPSGFVERTRTYKSLTAMTSDGWTVNQGGYKMAAKAFAQSPRPKQVKIGRCTLKPTVSYQADVTDNTVGRVYSIKGGATTATYEVQTGDSNSDIATALAALLTVDASFNASAAGVAISMSGASAGVIWGLSDWSAELDVKATSADPGIATDLAAIKAFDNDWYGLSLEHCSGDISNAAAEWAESNEKLFGNDTSDYDCGTSSTADIMSDLKSFSYGRTFTIFSAHNTQEYAAAALMGNRFPYDPGSDTWAYKTLRSVKVSSITEAQVTHILSKNGIPYTTVAGVNLTQGGKVAGGEWVDVVRGIDWLKAEVTVRVFALLVQNQKIPYTDLGVDMVINEINGAMRAAVDVGFLAATPAYTITAPKVADVSVIDKGNRLLPDVNFSGTLAGAIHATDIMGTLSL